MNKSQIESNPKDNPFLKDWIILNTNQYKKPRNQSRFADLFKEILENDRKAEEKNKLLEKENQKKVNEELKKKFKEELEKKIISNDKNKIIEEDPKETENEKEKEKENNFSKQTDKIGRAHV